MANEPTITVVGNVTADAELRFLPSGVAVCNFTVASTPRVKDGDNWKDGETAFFRVAVWRDMAEHAAESIKRGLRVVVTGRFKVRGYEVEGQQRQSLEIDADEVGVSIRYGTVSYAKVERQQAGQQPPTDPWTTGPGATPQQGAPAGWGAPQQGPPPGWAQPAQQPAAPQQQQGWGPPPDYPAPPY
jgi:single-strand DNA-binding protein